MAVVALAAIATYFGSASVVYAAYAAYTAYKLLNPPKRPDQNITGPRLSDLQIQSSAYGQMIPLVYATARVAGNIIWSSEVREVATTTSQTQGGKGGSSQTVTQTTYSYFVDVAIALSEGELTAVRRIWVNGELKYDVSTSASTSSVAASALGARSMIFYPGSETQEVDPTIEAEEGTSTPAYRGLAYIVIEHMDVTPYGGKVPQLDFEVVASGTVASTLDISDGSTVGTTSTLSSSLTPVLGSNGNAWYFGAVSNTAVMVNYYSGSTAATYTRATWGYIPCGVSYDGNCGVYNNYGGYFGYLNSDGSVTEYTGGPGIMGANGLAWMSDQTGFAQGDGSSGFNFYRFTLNNETSTVDETAITDARSARIFHNGCAIAGRCYVYGASTYSHDVGYIETSANSKVLLFTGTSYGTNAILVSRDGYLWMGKSSGTNAIEKRDQDGTLIDSVVLPGSVAAQILREAPDGTIMASTGTGAVYLIHPETIAVSYTSEAAGTRTPIGFLEDGRLILSSTSGSNFLLHEMERLPRVSTSTVTLASVVTDLCYWAGLSASEIDVSELTDTVGGYAIARRDSIRSALEPLRVAYKFDACESGGQIAFRKRGRAVSVVIEEDDLAARRYGDEPPAKMASERVMETELPDEIAVQHIDPALNYEVNSQYARRLTGQSVAVLNVDIPLVLTTAEAAGSAEYLLYDAWVSRNTQTIQVSRKHAALEPCDVVQFESDGVTRTSRIVDVDDGGGVIKLTLVDDDSDIVDTVAAGVAGPTPDSTVSAIGPSIGRLLDIPLLRDVDDGAGFYAVSCGLYDGWRGAELWMSRDQGVTWERTTTSFLTASVIGTAVTVLPDFLGGNVFDELSTVDVQVINGELSSTTETLVRAGANACYLGGELLHFKTATLVSAGRYTLSGLRRGRKGTEQYMSTHAIGDSFVLLNQDVVARVDLTTTDISASLQFKVVTFGQNIYEAATIPFTPAAVGLECYSPVNIRAGRSAAASYDITISWNRRNRLDGEWRNFSDVPQSETSASYEVDVYASSAFSTIKRTLTSSTETATYTSAQQVTDFGSNQTTVYLKVYQLSSVTGRGFAGTATINV